MERKIRLVSVAIVVAGMYLLATPGAGEARAMVGRGEECEYSDCMAICMGDTSEQLCANSDSDFDECHGQCEVCGPSYSPCMQHCIPEYGFLACHALCNLY
jgi:hypothetical protein